MLEHLAQGYLQVRYNKEIIFFIFFYWLISNEGKAFHWLCPWIYLKHAGLKLATSATSALPLLKPFSVSQNISHPSILYAALKLDILEV